MIGLRPPWGLLGGLVGVTVVVAIATHQPRPPVPHVSSPLPDPRLAGELAAIAARYLAAHPEPPTCAHPPDPALDTRLARWIDRQFPDEFASGNLVVNAHCDGIVEVSEDRSTKGHRGDAANVHSYSTARSWIVRVDDAITVLAHAEGIGEATRRDGSPQARVTVIGQVDLDGDGLRDVVWARYANGAGDATADYQVSAWRSTTRASSRIVKLRDLRDLELTQDRVLALYRGGGIDGWIYRCIDESLAVTPCPAAEVRRRSVRAAALADDYTSPNTSPSEREDLANDLDLLDVPVADRPRLLAMAAPRGWRAEDHIGSRSSAAMTSGNGASLSKTCTHDGSSMK